MTRQAQRALLILLMAIWGGSFFVPALYVEKPVPGYFAAFLSIFMMFTAARNLLARDFNDLGYMIYTGSFYLANAFMIAAPFASRIARRGGGKTFLVLMTIWDALTLSWLGYVKLKGNAGSVLPGWWMWEGSLIATTLLLFHIRREALHGQQTSG